MDYDIELLQILWDRHIPVCFQINQEDLDLMQSEPDPIYLMIPRQTYFPLYFDKLLKHWKKYIKPNFLMSEIWLENINGSALRWNIPVSVSYDLLPLSEKETFPWKIIVHFSNFPETDVLRWPTKDALESNFLSYIKEADFLKHRSQIINDLQPHVLKSFFQSLQNQKFEQFWKINKGLMNRISGDPFKSIPFKVYCEDWPGIVQHIISPIDEEGRQRSLNDLFALCFSSAGQDFPSNISADELLKKYKILIQGTSISMETPLQWLSEHLSTPDNFLHICLCR